MKWNNISVWQYQNIVKTLANKQEDEIEKSFKLIGIVYNMTENQVDSLTQAEYKAKLKECDFLNSMPEGKPVNIIKVNGKRYRLIYDVTRMPFGRYVESKAFVGDIYGNLHKLGATMVMPQKRNWIGLWVDDKYDAGWHDGRSGAGAADKRTAKALVVACPSHGWQQQAADGHHIRHARAR